MHLHSIIASFVRISHSIVQNNKKADFTILQGIRIDYLSTFLWISSRRQKKKLNFKEVAHSKSQVIILLVLTSKLSMSRGRNTFISILIL